MGKTSIYVYFVCLLIAISCKEKSKEIGIADETGLKDSLLFTLMTPDKTKLNFINVIEETPTVNGVLYEYLYNGGGVAVADFDNDGFEDVYFTSNLYSNKLFKNKGDLIFEDITSKAGVRGKPGFPTGVTVVDINGDGLQDIYVSKSGKYTDLDYRKNELYINKGTNEDGIPIFEEEAKKYNLDLPHYSTQAAFFDYDRDGDLDMFLLNHSIDPAETEYNIEKLLEEKSEYSANKLFRNENNNFVDVSKESGIINNSVGYGLGVAIGDLNNDQWPDILVGMDYSERDHLYLNKKNGTFEEVIKKSTNHISNFSMGNDIGDVNNDGRMDFISVDMVSDNNFDLKTNMSGMDPKRFHKLVELGLHHQYMFNALQLNNGNFEDNKSIPAFSDIAQYAGVSNTNWSWAPLFFDMDNDGWQDLFVTNGILRSFRNNDFIVEKRQRVAKLYEEMESFKNHDSLIASYYSELLAIMPEKKEINQFYLNSKNLRFTRIDKNLGIDVPSASNGAAYADFDNDGDLDLIINNINDPVFLYRNNSRGTEMGHNYLTIKLKGNEKNTNGIGAKLILTADNVVQTREMHLSRGFQSSVSNKILFGLGSASIVDKVSVIWPDGKTQSLQNVQSNQELLLDYSKASNETNIDLIHKTPLFKKEQPTKLFVHNENDFDDFKRESLLPHKFSQNGPALAIGDVNNDGLDDYYIGGAKNQSSALFLQSEDFTFTPTQQNVWQLDKRHEDISAHFFDADNDGDQDLYVVSGGNEEGQGNDFYLDRFYENQGNGNFKKINALPNTKNSGSVVISGDFDNDGDLDLFIGTKLIPGKYPFPASSYVLENVSTDSKIQFKNVTDTVAPFLNDFGMVSDAKWVDFDNDGYLDLIIVGEWMPIKIIKNLKGTFEDVTENTSLNKTVGWWFSVAAGDFDNDGDIDFIAGNLGLNYKYKASEKEPFRVYANDFDENGSIDIVLGYQEDGEIYPLRGRECTSNQMPFVKEKFSTYNEFAEANLFEIYGEDQIENSLNYAATTFATVYIENMGNFNFTIHELEGLAQFSSVNSIVVDDFNKDGYIDAFLSGNLYQSEVETTRNDASFGVTLIGEGNNTFKQLGPSESGLFLKGDIKKSGILQSENTERKYVVFAKNNESLDYYYYK